LGCGFVGGAVQDIAMPRAAVSTGSAVRAPGQGTPRPAGESTASAPAGDAVTSFAGVAAQVNPAVVNIDTFASVSVAGDPMRQLRRFLAPERRVPTPGEERSHEVPQGMGSGVIIREDGLILTNYHVVGRAQTQSIRVTLADGRTLDGEVVGKAPILDVAVLKVDASGLPTARLGDSSELRPGDWVVAIGNPFGFSHTVTAGVVSATGPIEARSERRGELRGDLIQTDASINPGNSGGPLVNLKGEVIGINEAIVSPGTPMGMGGNIGIGFAIPINAIKEIQQELIEQGRVVRAFVGIVMADIQPVLVERFRLPQDEGALVREVKPRSPAEKAGLRQGDIIVDVGGKKIRYLRDVQDQVWKLRVGQEVDFKVLRSTGPGKWDSKVVKIKTAEMPDAL
jgi:S1-C subfamily serine protease